MIGLRTTISGTTYNIDVFDDIDLKLNLSFAEIQNITLRNSTYSNTFYVPGSKINNQIFQYFFNINSTYTDYDVRKKMDAIITYDGWDLMTGYLRLNFVNIENTNIIYNLTFYSEFGNLIANIGDKFMRQLDLSDLSHPFNTPQVILDALKDPDLVPPTGTTYSYQDGRTYWLLANYGYEYDDNDQLNINSTPQIDFFDGNTAGYFDYIGTPVHYYYFKPCVQIRELYYQIFKDAGYEIESNFMDTAYFKRYYLPQSFNSEGLYLNQGIFPEYQTSASGDTSGFTWTDLVYTGLTGTYQRIRLTPTTIVDNAGINSLSDWTMNLPAIGNYKLKWTLKGYNSERVPESVDLSTYFKLYFHQIESGVDGTTGRTLANSADYTLPPGAGVSTGGEISFFGNPIYNYSFDFINSGLGSLVITEFTLELLLAPKSISGNLDYALEFPTDTFKQIDFIRSINTLFNLVVVPSTEKTRTLLVEPMVDYVGTGSVLDWTRKVDRSQPIQISPTSIIFNGSLNFKYKLDKDFGNDQYNKTTNKIFGELIHQLDTDYKDSIISFDTGLSTQVDYTLSNIANPTITLPYYFITTEEDDNGITKQYFNPYEIIPRILFRGTNLPGANSGTEVPYQPDCVCLDVEVENTNPYSAYITYIDCYNNPQGINISAFNSAFFCYCQGSLEVPGGCNIINNGNCGSLTGTSIIGTTWYLDTQPIDIFPVNNRFTTYPYAVSGFSHYTNFNRTSKFDLPEYYFANYDDLYSDYYSDYVEDLNSPDSRIWDGYIYLTPQEIASLDFREKIFIDNTYFRINKIEGYDPTTTQPVKVQLVKLTRSYNPHPTAYYDLIACGAYPDLHTNTDLTFGIWNYLGNYYLIDGNCYEVRRGEYNSAYTYQKIETTYSGTSYIPNIYTTCSCDVKITQNTIYQDPPVIPVTPSLTPVTPTPTPSAHDTNYYYIVERCGLASQTIAYSPSPVVIGSVVKVYISGLGYFCYVVKYPTYITSNNLIVSSYIDCDSCNDEPNPTPTPTSTPTSTPVVSPSSTPTPTPTPDCLPEIIYECSSPCCEGLCCCDNPVPVVVYAAPGVLPSDVGENLYTDCARTTLYNGTYQYGGVIYDASPISSICVIGGGC